MALLILNSWHKKDVSGQPHAMVTLLLEEIASVVPTEQEADLAFPL